MVRTRRAVNTTVEPVKENVVEVVVMPDINLTARPTKLEPKAKNPRVTKPAAPKATPKPAIAKQIAKTNGKSVTKSTLKSATKHEATSNSDDEELDADLTEEEEITPQPKQKKTVVRKVPVAKIKKDKVAKETNRKSLSPQLVGVSSVQQAPSPQKPKEVIDFSKFQVTRVINESTLTKSITFQGIYNEETAVIRMDKTLFDEVATKKALCDQGTVADRDFINDIYSSYIISSISSNNTINNLKATVICPANQSVLTKYSHADHTLFCETPDHYVKVVEPFIRNKLEKEKDYNQWVYNILDGKSEVERVILNDPDPDSGFMLVPDLKWSGDEKELNLIAICHRRDIRSLRDLNEKHLILLKNILTKGTKAIKDKYKKTKGQLRTYIHYQPSFYHFHVHFKMIDPSDYLSTDRDNLLSTVINNITLVDDYYRRSTLTYPLSHISVLYQELKKAKRI